MANLVSVESNIFQCALNNELIPGLTMSEPIRLAPLMTIGDSIFLAGSDGSFLKCTRPDGFIIGTFKFQFNGLQVARATTGESSQEEESVNCFAHTLDDSERSQANRNVSRRLEQSVREFSQGPSRLNSALAYAQEGWSMSRGYLSCMGFLSLKDKHDLQVIHTQLEQIILALGGIPGQRDSQLESGFADPQSIIRDHQETGVIQDGTR